MVLVTQNGSLPPCRQPVSEPRKGIISLFFTSGGVGKTMETIKKGVSLHLPDLRDG